MKLQRRSKPIKARTTLLATVVGLLIAILAACSPAGDSTASQSNEPTVQSESPQATAQVNDQPPTAAPTANKPANPTHTPEAQAEPTPQATPELLQPNPAAANEPPAQDREYTLKELREMIFDIANEHHTSSGNLPLRLGDSVVPQIRAEDAAAHCAGNEFPHPPEKRRLERRSEIALPTIYWDSQGVDSAAAFTLSGDGGHHSEVYVWHQPCEAGDPYTAKDWPQIIARHADEVRLPSHPLLNTLHIGLALADSPHSGYYIYAMLTAEHIEWIDPPMVEGSILKASGNVPMNGWLALNYIRTTPEQVSELQEHPCHRHEQAIASITSNLAELVKTGRFNGPNQPDDPEPSHENHHSFPLVRLHKSETRCIADAGPTGYLIQADKRLWAYEEGDRIFDVEVDLTPILEDPSYGRGDYIVEFRMALPDVDVVLPVTRYAIWLGMDPPENHLYEQP